MNAKNDIYSKFLIIVVLAFGLVFYPMMGTPQAQSAELDLNLNDQLRDVSDLSDVNNYATGVLYLGDQLNNFSTVRPYYLIIDSNNHMFLQTTRPAGANELDPLWSRTVSVEYNPNLSQSTECATNSFSRMALANGLFPSNGEAFAVSDPKASLGITVPGANGGPPVPLDEVGYACFYDTNTGDLLGQIVGHGAGDRLGISMIGLPDHDGNGYGEFLIGTETSGIHLYDGKAILDYAGNAGFVPSVVSSSNLPFYPDVAGGFGASMDSIDTPEGTYVAVSSKNKFLSNFFYTHGQVSFIEISNTSENGTTMTHHGDVKGLVYLIFGNTWRQYGHSVAVAATSDPNNSILFVGAPGHAQPGYEIDGRVVVYNLKYEGPNADPRFSTTFLKTIINEEAGISFGWTVKSLGADLNGDGIEDVAIFDPSYNPALNLGRVYVYSGADQEVIDILENKIPDLNSSNFGVSDSKNIVDGVINPNGDGENHIAVGSPLDTSNSPSGVANVYGGYFNLTATPNPVVQGESTTIEWDASSRYVMCLSATPEWVPGQDIGLSGSAEVPIHVKTNIKIICVNHGGYGDEEDIWVNITFPPPPAQESECENEECPPPESEEEAE